MLDTETELRRRDAAVDAQAAKKARDSWRARLREQARSMLPPEASEADVEKLADALRRPTQVRVALIGVIQRRRQRTQPLTHPVVESTPEMKKVAVKSPPR